MSIATHSITNEERLKILSFTEGHFGDLKAIEITPGKLTRTISALSNAEGGEIYIGIAENNVTGERLWKGFFDPEQANAHLQVFETLFPLGDGFSYCFLSSSVDSGLVLKIDISKNRSVKLASDGKVYVRRGAQNLSIDDDQGLLRLRRNKGIISFESETIPVDPENIFNSIVTLEFMIEVVPIAEPNNWLRKQQLIIDNKPTVAGVVLFSEEPQALLPKRSGLKIYRYQTSNDEGSRDSLAFDPISVEGHAYKQIYDSVKKAADIIEGVRINTPAGLESVRYPITALHEVITNAVLHRNYSIADDIHIRIFDNRVEVLSPGTLPAHITPDNILEERFARNAAIVRLINKFPNPPNKDVGEGLNTAFDAMRNMKLKPPTIHQNEGFVKVVLRHEPLATPEELILEYLQANEKITNRIARQISYIGSENKMKIILQRMVKNNFIELGPGTTRYSAAYRLRPS